VKIIFPRILIIAVLVNSIFVSESSIKLINGQTTNIVTNVTDLTKSDLSNADVQLENKTIDYFTQAHGYLVYPSKSNPINSKIENNMKLPGVVMIHENKGLNENIKSTANLLAKNGYVVLAVDLFKGEVTTDRNRSSELTQQIRDNQYIATFNLKSAVKYLASLPNVNPEKIDH